MINLNLESVTGVRKNYLKNPNFAVIQGAASGIVANSLDLPTASLGYQGETEWAIAASGGNPTYVFNSIGESVTITGAAGTTEINLLQRLESRDTIRLKGKTVTFSCEISNSENTGVVWDIRHPNFPDSHGTINVSFQTQIASGLFVINSTLKRYSATFTLPNEAALGLEIRLKVSEQPSGTWVISRMQLEEGSTASNFNCGSYSEELARCQRYYERLVCFAQSDANLGGDTNAGLGKTYKEEKFSSSPVVSLTDFGGSNFASTTLENVTATELQIIWQYLAGASIVSRKFIATALVSAHIP